MTELFAEPSYKIYVFVFDFQSNQKGLNEPKEKNKTKKRQKKKTKKKKKQTNKKTIVRNNSLLMYITANPEFTLYWWKQECIHCIVLFKYNMRHIVGNVPFNICA